MKWKEYIKTLSADNLMDQVNLCTHIFELDNRTERTIMVQKYLKGRSLEDIAYDLDLSLLSVIDLHRKIMRRKIDTLD